MKKIENNLTQGSVFKKLWAFTIPLIGANLLQILYGMVDLKFKVFSLNPMIVHAGVVNIDYYITFGELEGFILDEAGTKYDLTGCMGMGEDKTMLL